MNKQKGLNLLILVQLLLFLSAATFAQNDAKVSVNVKNASLKEVFNAIEKQTTYRFSYRNVVVDSEQNITLTKSGDVSSILDEALAGRNLVYSIVSSKSIVISDKPATEDGQNVLVKYSGTVRDTNDEPVIGANVVVKGGRSGTITDLEGRFSIDAPVGAVLQITFIGYSTQEITLGDNRQTLHVVLAEDTRALNEVVVTALGVKREQRAVGYATQKLSGVDILQANTPNIAGSFSGKLAGVIINNANQPDGGSTRIVIRGNNNIQGNNQPLIIVDGMPLENNIKVNISSNNNTSESTARVRDLGSGINFINSNDVEEMNILKGPAAAALYGARGANGVILITTKKGQKKDGIGIDYSFTAKVVNPYLYRDQQNEYGYGGLHLPMYTAETKYEQDTDGAYMYPKMTWGNPRYDAIYGQMPGGYNTYDDAAFTWHAYSVSWGPRFDGKNIRWWDGEMRPYQGNPDGYKSLFRNGSSNTHNLSFSGGGEFGTVRVGFTREDNKAIIEKSGYGRTAFTLGSSLKISKTLKAEIYANYNNFSRNNITEIGNDDNGITKYFYLFPTDYRPELAKSMYKNSDGSRHDFGNTYGAGNDIFWNLYENTYNYDRDQLLGNVKLIYNPLNWLTMSVSGGLDFNLGDIVEKKAPTDAYGLQGGYYSHELRKEKVENIDFIATARQDNLFMDKFNAGFSLGATRWDRSYYQMKGQTYGTFKDPYIYTFGNFDLSKQNNQVHADQVPTEDFLTKRINSVYGFLDLSYGNWVYAQITGRNDWSSTLPASNNSYFYPSASLSFVVTELLDMPRWWNFGKIRLAYAKAANDTDPYQVFQTYNSGSYAGSPYTTLRNTLPPTDLKPQLSNSYEVGLNTAMFDSRFKFDITFYRTRSYNQIMNAPVATSSGYDRIRFNTGEMENMGIEIMTGFDVLKSRDWDWNIGLNFANNQNKLISMTDGTDVFEIAEIFGSAGPRLVVEVGDKYGNIYGWDYMRNDKGEKIIEVIYDKTDPSKVAGTKYKTTPTQVKLGNITPDVTGGLSSSLRWKNLSLYVLADFSYGGDMWSGTYATSLSSGLSPSTLLERNGGGLPYTYPDGTKANHGIIMDGVLEDGTPNTHVVHYVWKYGRLGAWGNGNLTVPSILKNDWIKLREITLNYDLPKELIKKTKIFQTLGIGFTARDLFYIYSSLPDNLNPEALSNSAGNGQGLEFGALPGVRSFNFSIRAGF
ncbi:MAG: SusC/RagA family TonB-linked outer membrane protein [Dysgonamonadaceae bacterium]|jgi:iron complex outermembrane receptor protein|nr:SusC/RagA family TonB-linked outer membrane protein [Dysgonamonadaceae bacterium]